MSQYILDCPTIDRCTMQPYSAPPATVDHYTLMPAWAWVPSALVVLAVVLAVAIVRYKAHEEQASVQRARINNPPKQCPTCGDVLETKEKQR